MPAGILVFTIRLHLHGTLLFSSNDRLHAQTDKSSIPRSKLSQPWRNELMGLASMNGMSLETGVGLLNISECNLCIYSSTPAYMHKQDSNEQS